MTGNAGQQDKPAWEMYYSYAPQDEAFCLELEKHLKPLERDNLVKGWHRGKIPGGTNESQEIENHRDCANVILLLLSSDYVASDDCYAEMQWALERKQADGLLVIPIILRPIEAEDIPFKTAQLLPTRGRTVTNWPSHDEAFQDILLGMRRLLERQEQQQRQPAQSLVWNLPYTRNPLFTGRDKLLQQLHANLTASKAAVLTQPQAISGLGGIVRHEAARVIVSGNNGVRTKPAVPPAVSLNGEAGRQQPVRSPLTTTLNRKVGSQTARGGCYLLASKRIRG